MPPFARRCFRTALLFLALGILTGLHMSSAMHLGAGAMHSYYVPAHAHVLLVGFLMLALMGVAHWKLLEAPAGASARWAELAFWSVALGTAGRYAFEIGLGYREARWLHLAAFVASCVQGGGLLLFGRGVWVRLGR